MCVGDSWFAERTPSGEMLILSWRKRILLLLLSTSKLTFFFPSGYFLFCFVLFFDGFITNPAALREGKRGWRSVDAPISHEDRVGTLSGSSSALAGLRRGLRGRRRRSRPATSTTSAFKAPLPESAPRQRRSRREQRRLHGHEPAGWPGSSRRKRQNEGNAHGTTGT